MVCITPMMVPFQTIMISLTQVARRLHLGGSLQGLIVQYWGFGAPFAIFLYHGFIKTVPRELDEHARIDGASTVRLFISIIFPMLKSVTITIIVIDAMWIWNDFLLPLLMISSNKKLVNIQVVLYQNIGYYYAKWEYALPMVVMSIIPALLIFVALQKYIVEGVTAGAIKG
jgi:raffinose/stachyose/melibiose transport system permease protein